jgi:hypothetical protein
MCIIIHDFFLKKLDNEEIVPRMLHFDGREERNGGKERKEERVGKNSLYEFEVQDQESYIA